MVNFAPSGYMVVFLMYLSTPPQSTPGPRKQDYNPGMGATLSSELGTFLNLCPPMYTEPRSGLPLWVAMASR